MNMVSGLTFIFGFLIWGLLPVFLVVVSEGGLSLGFEIFVDIGDLSSDSSKTSSSLSFSGSILGTSSCGTK
jgi:hypothetical protein